MTTRSSLGRMGSPDEVAKVASFLGSDESSYVTSRLCRRRPGTDLSVSLQEMVSYCVGMTISISETKGSV